MATGLGAGRWPVLAILLLTTAVLLGGGGSPDPVPELIVELVALLTIAAAIAAGWRPMGALRQDPRWTLAIGAILLFPLVQLVPLPPALWQALPGRDMTTAAAQAVGEGDAWRPWSLLPDGGVAAACALLPALALALLTAALPIANRVRLIAAVAVLGAVAALFGLVQFMRGPDLPLSLYGYLHNGFAVGFFASRNAQADLIAVTLIAAVLLLDRHRAWLASGATRIGVAASLLLVLASGVATGSRMGLAMLLVPVALGAALAGRHARGPALALAAAAVALIAGGTALDRVVGRVHDAGNRVEIWGDSLFVARTVAPVGAGMGSFVPLYAAAERLELVQPTYANRAHNGYLELAIEGGAPALLLLAAMMAFAARRAWAGWRDPDPDQRLLARFAGLSLLVFAFHSTVDYPLRTLTLLTVAGLATGVLARAPAEEQADAMAWQGTSRAHA